MTLLSAWLLVDKYSSSPRSVPPIPGAHSTCTADARAPVRPAPAAQLLTHFGVNVSAVMAGYCPTSFRILSDLVPPHPLHTRRVGDHPIEQNGRCSTSAMSGSTASG